MVVALSWVSLTNNLIHCLSCTLIFVISWFFLCVQLLLFYVLRAVVAYILIKLSLFPCMFVLCCCWLLLMLLVGQQKGFLPIVLPYTLGSSIGIILLFVRPSVCDAAAGGIVRAAQATDGSTRSSGTTTTYHQLICGGDPSCEVIRGWRYGPCRIRINDDELKCLKSK